MKNRLGNVNNPYQGKYTKVLCVCSAGMLRSPTMAKVLANEPYNCNTRAVGLSKEFALIPIDDVLLTWADVIICFDFTQELTIKDMLIDLNLHEKCKVFNVDIPDEYDYNSPELLELCEFAANELYKSHL